MHLPDPRLLCYSRCRGGLGFGMIHRFLLLLIGGDEKVDVAADVLTACRLQFAGSCL
jgi:hypothetical protein